MFQHLTKKDKIDYFGFIESIYVCQMPYFNAKILKQKKNWSKICSSKHI